MCCKSSPKQPQKVQKEETSTPFRERALCNWDVQDKVSTKKFKFSLGVCKFHKSFYHLVRELEESKTTSLRTTWQATRYPFFTENSSFFSPCQISLSSLDWPPIGMVWINLASSGEKCWNKVPMSQEHDVAIREVMVLEEGRNLVNALSDHIGEEANWPRKYPHEIQVLQWRPCFRRFWPQKRLRQIKEGWPNSAKRKSLSLE